MYTFTKKKTSFKAFCHRNVFLLWTDLIPLTFAIALWKIAWDSPELVWYKTYPLPLILTTYLLFRMGRHWKKLNAPKLTDFEINEKGMRLHYNKQYDVVQIDWDELDHVDYYRGETVDDAEDTADFSATLNFYGIFRDGKRMPVTPVVGMLSDRFAGDSPQSVVEVLMSLDAVKDKIECV